jgi:hypothetical protein
MTTPEDPFATPPPGTGPPAGYGPPQGYGPPPGQPQQWRQEQPGTNGFAIASLACSIGTFFTGFTFILGVIFGHIARKQIKQTGESGDGLAVAGLVIGYVFVGLSALLVVIFVGALASFS